MVARTLMAGTLLNRVARIRVALTMEIHPVVVLHGSGAVRLNLPASSVDPLGNKCTTSPARALSR